VYKLWNCLVSLNIMFLRFIQVVQCVYNLFFFIAEKYSTVWMYHSCLSIHPMKDIWVVLCFRQL
jgi:hypothetical protein